jgi:hypothetical protein
MTEEHSHREDPWAPVNLQAWSETSCIVGRAANEQDVKDGRAVFYIDGPSEPVDLELPHCALLREETGQMLPIVAIQAETCVPGQVLIGYRPLDGGNGICTLDEVDLLDVPDKRFTQYSSQTDSSD